MPKKKRSGFWFSLSQFLNDFAVYVITVVGVILGKYIPEYKAGHSIHIVIGFNGDLLIAAFIGLLVTFLVENEEEIKGASFEERQMAKEGKRKNFKRRALTHLTQGSFWYMLVGGVGHKAIAEVANQISLLLFK